MFGKIHGGTAVSPCFNCPSRVSVHISMRNIKDHSTTTVFCWRLPHDRIVRPQVNVPQRVSGGHKDIQGIDGTRTRVSARHVKILLRGRKRSCCNNPCYWIEYFRFLRRERLYVYVERTSIFPRMIQWQVGVGSMCRRGGVGSTRPGRSPYKLAALSSISSYVALRTRWTENTFPRTVPAPAEL